MTTKVQVRVIEWTAPGYEGSYTQYTVWDDATYTIEQVATRDNMARGLQGKPLLVHTSGVDKAMWNVSRLIENRVGDDAAKEI
jgi:hypothetical protein